MNKYPNSGRLNYAKNKVNPNSADIYGEIVFDRQFLRNILNETDSDDIPVKLSGWQKDGNYGPWFAIRVNTYKKEEGAAPKAAPTPDSDEDSIPF